MVRKAREDALQGWLNEAEDGLLGAFAHRLRRDLNRTGFAGGFNS
ncbi:hypothetical protein [Leisingera sp. ANG59]|nr:hypothetical protein [Leisingera sp. ANG59]